jgi:DSF synthase
MIILRRSYHGLGRTVTKLGRERSEIPAAEPSLRPLPESPVAAAAAGGVVRPVVLGHFGGPYADLDLRLDRRDKGLWYFMNPQERPSFTHGLMRDMRQLHVSLRRFFAEHPGEARDSVRYFVMASRLPGIFNLGGDLRLFAEKIRARDRQSLQTYARATLELLTEYARNLDLPIVTIALVQGDALGGGFEAALCNNVIVAERSAKFGLPEILFNLFPGMGAYSFLSRRIGPAEAEKLIFSGRIYSAEELHELGVVDVVADDGRGEDAVRDYIDRHGRRFNARRAVYQVRQRVNPITHEELRDVLDIWVEAALGLEEADLRKMERLAAAQDRRTIAIDRGRRVAAAPVVAV